MHNVDRSLLCFVLWIRSSRACRKALNAQLPPCYQGVVGISDIIIQPGLINVDFADVQSVMGSSGLAFMGIGKVEGTPRARDEAFAAVSSPLIDFPIAQVSAGIDGKHIGLGEGNREAGSSTR